MKHVFRYLVAEAPEPGVSVGLTDDDAHHLTRVVRHRVGDTVELTDGRGGLWCGVVATLDPLVTIEVYEERPAPPVPDVVLYAGTLEQARLDLLIEKASELGVPEVVVFASERSRRVPAADEWRRRARRRERLVEAAARQSGQAVLTRVRGVVPFEAVLAEIPSGEGLILDHDADQPLGPTLAGRRAARLLVGPDSGFDASEIAAAREAGHRVCSVGPSTLRAETAGLVAMSLALDAVGHLRETVHE